MELSPHETDLVLQYRREQVEAAKVKQRALALLKAAFEYEKWLQENDRGTSYTTFLDEFGFKGDHTSSTYNQVIYLIYAAREGRIEVE